MINLKKLRAQSGFSQVALAQQSGVSLPTIQKIEAHQANPTLEIIQKILETLGLELSIKIMTWNPDLAINLGVPLSSQKLKSLKTDQNQLIRESKKWAHHLKSNQLKEREKDALISFLMAIKDEYPSFYKKWIESPLFNRLIENSRKNGKIIKLRRISLSHLSEYL